jgi:WD40 repeat protein
MNFIKSMFLLSGLLVFSFSPAFAGDALSFSPDGSKVLYESNESGSWCEAAVYDVNTGSKIQSFVFDPDDDCRASSVFSPDSRYLATNRDRDSLLFDFQTGNARVLSNVGRMSFSPDGKHVAHWEREFITIYATSSAKKETLLVHDESVRDARFTSDSKILVGPSITGVRFVPYNSNSGLRLSDFSIDSHDYEFSADVKYLLTSESIYSALTGGRFGNVPQDVRSPMLTANSKYLLTRSHSDESQLRVYTWPEMKEHARFPEMSPSRYSRYHYVVSNDGATLIAYQDQLDLIAWDLQTGREKWRNQAGAWDAVFSADSVHLVTRRGSELSLWDVQSGKLKAILQ